MIPLIHTMNLTKLVNASTLTILFALLTLCVLVVLLTQNSTQMFYKIIIKFNNL